MTALRCPRCSAHIVDNVVHVEDSATGLYVVTADPVADYLHACRCGADIVVSSSHPTRHHPGQQRLLGGAV